jgi:hypothetical protein
LRAVWGLLEQQAVAEQARTTPVVQPLQKKAEDPARDPSGKV